MTIGRKIKLGFWVVCLGGAIGYWYSVSYPSIFYSEEVEVTPSFYKAADTARLNKALKYCDTYGYSKKVAILMDLSTHSGNYRFFVIDLRTEDVLLKGLVAHGHCQTTEYRLAQFSNEEGSNCSSLGHYRIGGKYEGSFGTSYKLIGKDPTNSNAFDRYVVLHSHSCVPIKAQADDICNSEGCPTIAPEVLEMLIPYLDNTDKPVLLWIYR